MYLPPQTLEGTELMGAGQTHSASRAEPSTGPSCSQQHQTHSSPLPSTAPISAHTLQCCCSCVPGRQRGTETWSSKRSSAAPANQQQHDRERCSRATRYQRKTDVNFSFYFHRKSTATNKASTPEDKSRAPSAQRRALRSGPQAGSAPGGNDPSGVSRDLIDSARNKPQLVKGESGSARLRGHGLRG